MAKKFKYDIYSLIELVESKECLWDVSKEKKIAKKCMARYLRLFWAKFWGDGPHNQWQIHIHIIHILTKNAPQKWKNKQLQTQKSKE